MKKRLICIVVCLGMLMLSINASAYINYTPGDITQELIVSEINLGANEEKSFDTVLNFDAMSLAVSYIAETDVNLTLKTGRGENTITLPADKAKAEIAIKPELRYGENTVSLKADAPVTILSLTFNKVDYYPLSGRLLETVAYTDYEKAMEDVVVIGAGNTVLKVNGALRYVDYDNADVSARLLDGKLYLPVKAFARAFSLYCEDYSDYKNFVYLSNDTFELYCSSHNGSYYVLNGKKATIKNPVVYINSNAYLPVRYTAELMGKTVGYKSGLAVIGERLNVENIINDDAIFAELIDEISKFTLSLKTKGSTYYVSAKDGSDNNYGTENNPFKTIGKAAEKAKPGDTVIIKGGIYRETVTPQNSGTATSPIIYQAAEGADVTISAMDTVSGFSKYSGNIYSAAIPKSMGVGRNFVAIQGDAAIEGRHPNGDTHPKAKMYSTNDTAFERKLYPTVGDFTLAEKDTDANAFTFTSSNDLGQTTDYWKGATFVSLYKEGWTLSTGEVTSSENGKIVVKDIAPSVYGFTYYNQFDAKEYETDYGYMTNHLNTVDCEGEWYIDGTNNKIYIIPQDGTIGENLEVELKQRQTVIDLTEKSYIQFKGINTFGGGITMKESTMCVINGGTHKYISHFTQNTSPHMGALGTATNDPEAPQTKGEVGEYISGKNNAFVNTHINGSAGAGIYTAGAYSYIENNTVLNTDYAGIYPSGITIEGERWHEDNIVRGGHTIVHNTVKYAGRGCLYNSQNSRKVGTTNIVFPTVANDIGYNEFGRGCLISRDGGVVYEHGIAAGNDTKKSTLHHNIVFDNVLQKPSATYTYGGLIYRDAHTTFEKCYSNICFNTDNDPEFAGKLATNNKAFLLYTNSSAPSYTEDYNNIFLGYQPDGIAGLLPGDYPGGRMFLAGADAEERYLYNIEETASEKTILASEFTLENGATLKNGVAKINTRNNAITTDEIYADGKAKMVKLSYMGDKYDMLVYNVDLDVLQNDSVVYTASEYITGGGANLSDITEKVFYIPAFEGSIKLRLRAGVNNPLSIAKIVIEDYEGEMPTRKFPQGSNIILAGTGEVISHNGVDLQFKQNVKQNDDFTNMSIAKIRNTELSYDVDTNEINAIQLMIGVDYKNKFGTITVYADEDETPLCTINVNELFDNTCPDEKDWTRLVPKAEFSRTLPAGQHNIRIVFRQTAASFTPDFINIALYNTNNQ